ncbi:phage holin family protein [Thauera sp. CAU 1555]|jgi:putative membrane protein|uniref:Phage holin family protein n=1 Tax=Thauera sedimentorum TaxID=2767595 RepID=A0ABR9BAP2_9RHOO|nr:phage holin family protein [Thauera sedimentorum]MBC9072189.1 phage holin family protein [Thauera sedimentorum]MBD8503108.1 phage holin family protein [Thauera sedimentorum]
MGPRLRLLLQIALNAVALMLLPELIDGLRVESWTAALLTALLLGLINALVRPILILITLPITVLTLGLFTLVINAFLFWGVAALVSGVHVADFWTAFWSALLYSLLTWLVGLALGDPRDRRVRIVVGRRD